MKKVFTLLTFLITLTIILPQQIWAQRSVPGDPPSSLYKDIPVQVDHRVFDAPDMAVIEAEDAADPIHYRVGVAVPVNLDMENSGFWTDLPDGGKIWRLSLEAEGAQALGVYYDNFWIPYGGELYLYNEEKTFVIGAYSEENNNGECVFATQLVEGDVVTLEYYQPAEQSIEPIISISEISYNYRGAKFSSLEDGGSLWCMINVNCPEGDNWQDQKKGAVKQYMKIGWGYYFCSGSMINTTEQDLTPYVLTAWHCGEGASAADRNQWVFYFNYEAAACTGNWGPANYTMTGCDLRAEGNYSTGSDFLLIELKYNVPTSYNTYFNGWDRSNVGADSGVSIHHPAGDIKKISTFETPATSSPWNNNGVLSHWKVWWAETVNGTSITEGGSSGSPLFSQDGLIVGDLTGGPADNCENPLYSLYGKVYYSWDKMGTLASQRLKPWLDPGDYGPITWEGTYAGTAPTADFTADETAIQVGDDVHFDDLTTGNPLEWEWTFEGGDPASYTGHSPPGITYSAPGRYDVTLEASNTIGSSTKENLEMIVVGGPLAGFSASNDYLTSGETTDFTDETTNDPFSWNWTFEGGDPETSTEQNPTGITYNEQGAYDVTLVVENEYGTDSVTMDDFIVVDGPFADFDADLTFVAPGESVTFNDISINNPTSWNWKFFGGQPGTFNGQDPPPIKYNANGTWNVKLTVSNDLGNNSVTKVDFITVGYVGVGENDLESAVRIFPNPSQGKFSLELTNKTFAGASISIINAKGELVLDEKLAKNDITMDIDISNEPAGIYMVRIQSEEQTISRRVTLTK